MTNVWVLAISTVPVVVAALRELVALRRYRLRRASIERVLHDLSPGSRVVDQDADGAVVEVTIEYLGTEAARRPHEPAV